MSASRKFDEKKIKALVSAKGLKVDTSDTALAPMDGLFARFDEKGTLSEFGFRKGGRGEGWSLIVSGDGVSTCARNQSLRYPEHAALNPDTQNPESFNEWIERWVGDICDNVNDHERCSFCGKDRDNAEWLLTGKNDVYICDECVTAMADIIETQLKIPATNA